MALGAGPNVQGVRPLQILRDAAVLPPRAVPPVALHSQPEIAVPHGLRRALVFESLAWCKCSFDFMIL